jgi:hypothetical protein
MKISLKSWVKLEILTLNLRKILKKKKRKMKKMKRMTTMKIMAKIKKETKNGI